MSTVVNARDVFLQANLPRILPALLPGNLTVATTNVIGYPDFYSSVRSVEIGATNQVFVNTAVGGVTPSSIVLTAVLHNILGAVTWSVISGSATYTTGTNTLSIANSGMTSSAVVIQASVTSNGFTYTDQMTVVKVVENAPTITAFLTNENATLAALAGGNVLSYGYSGGQFKVYQGSVDVTGTAVTYSIVSATSVSPTIATTGIYSITNLVADTGTFTVRATYAGTSVDKIYTVVKSKSTFIGDNGATGVRGNVNIAASTTGSVWSDTAAIYALSSNGYGAPILKDVVTLYNTSTSYSESKFYNGSAFISLDAYINGNLLVTGTIVADKLAAGSITADKMVVGTITAASAIIADAAITNAKIGGDIQSTNYVAGTSGWRLDRSGNLYAVNGQFMGSLSGADITGATGSFSGNLSAASGTFSGNLTASAISAVSTINIGPNQVTIPLGANGAPSNTTYGGYGNNPNAVIDVQFVSLSILSTGAPIIVIYSSNITYDSTTTTGSGSSGPVVVQLTRDGVAIQAGISGAYRDVPGAGTHTYTLRTNAASSEGQTIHVTSATLVLLEAKR